MARMNFQNSILSMGSPKIVKVEMCEASDVLIGLKDHIEFRLFTALKLGTSLIYYDFTSSYFEGRESNDLVLFGYF